MQSYCERFHSMYNDSDPDTDCYCIVQNNTKTEVESQARIEYKLGQRKFTNLLIRPRNLTFRRIEIFESSIKSEYFKTLLLNIEL